MISSRHVSLALAGVNHSSSAICFLQSKKRNSEIHRLFRYRFFSKLGEHNGCCFHDRLLLLQHLGDTGDFKRGKSLHSFCIKSGTYQDVYLQNNLLRFYSVGGDLRSARFLFDEMVERNLVSWTSMVSGYVHAGHYEDGLKMFSLMSWSGQRANEFGLSVALKACRGLKDFVTGKVIHGRILKCGFESCSFCNTSMLGLYAEYGDIETAQRLFDGMPMQERSDALWNTLLNGYVGIAEVEEAVRLFQQMLLCNILPNSFTYSILVKLCADVLHFDLARLFHGTILRVGFEAHPVVGGALVDAYVKMGFFNDACRVFESLENKDNLVWCALLAGFRQNGHPCEGLKFYQKFVSEGYKPDPFIYASVFSLCSHVESGYVIGQAHCSFIKDGFLMDSCLGSALIDTYGSLEMVFDSYKCFLVVEQKNNICYGSIINVLLLHSYEEMALDLFSEMVNLGLQPALATLNHAIRACANIKALREGKSLHSYIIKSILEPDSSLSTENGLIEMYAKFGEVDIMANVFRGVKKRNEFTWTSALAGLSEFGLFEEALRLFQGIFLSPIPIKPSEFTMVAVIHACTKLAALGKGKQSHAYAMKVGFDSNPFVQSALISMYATFKHEIPNAFLVFSSMMEPDLVSLSTMVTAWAQNGYNEEALKLFMEYRSSGNFLADDSILTSCLSACAGLASLKMGKWLHAYAIRTGFVSHSHVASSIIDMYSKCGDITDAQNFFGEMDNNNLVCCTSMMSGYAYSGLGEEAIEVFKEMKESGIKPDGVAFISVLTACSHAGLVDEGWNIFKLMKEDYGLEVSVNHYACMVDLLGRAEQVEEAEAFIKAVPLETKAKSLLWKILLGACSKYENIELGRHIGQIAVEMEPDDLSNYVLLSNIYSKAEMWSNSSALRSKMRGKHVNKQAGYSLIQVES